MTTKVVPGILIATPDAQNVAREAAVRMARGLRDAIEARGAAYGLLAKDTSVDWAKVEVLWVDERAVAPTDDRSNYLHAKETLLDPAHVPAARIHRMPADEPDLESAARNYERVVRTCVAAGERDVPVFDVIVLGVGDDGHTASLFPGEPTVELTDRYVAAVPAKGDREARLTLTAPVLEAARSVIVLAVGSAKNGPLERVWLVEGSLRDTPARIIRHIRGSVAWIIDRAAGGL
jgi:6-phosphogluconolactonase